MTPQAVVRAMRAEDIVSVLEIQSRCYDAARQESAASFLAKLTAAPASCFVALLHDRPAGYLVAIPAAAGRPPPLHSPTCAIPAAADALYLHDLAIPPEARGAGVAAVLLQAYFAALKPMQARFACLTAVNGSRLFWERHGFRLTEPAAGQLDSYGEDAEYMSLPVEA